MANMHLVTGYAGKEHVTSDDQGSFNASFFGEESFVLNGKDKFDYEIISNTEIKIKPGDFYTQGRFIRLQNPVVLNFGVGSQEGARTDSIYIKYTKNPQTEIEECNLIVIDGRNTETLNKVKQQSLKKDAILKGENEAYFLMYNVQFNGLNLSNIQKKFEIKENYKKEFEKFASNADAFLKNKVKQTNETLNSLIEKTDTNLKKKFENADLIGELKDLNTKNKTSLVSAINEVFQFGVDKGNKIVSKLNALFDKEMINLEEVANEMDKCDVKYKTFFVKNMKKKPGFFDENIEFDYFSIFKDKAFLFKDKTEYFSESNTQIYDLNTESQVKFTYVDSEKYDFKNSTNLYTILKIYDNMLLFDDSSNKIIRITGRDIGFSMYDSYLIKLNNKYLLIHLDYEKLNVYDMVEKKIIKTINFEPRVTFLAVQKNKIYFINKEMNLVIILDSNFQKIRSISIPHETESNRNNFFVLKDVFIDFFRNNGEDYYVYLYNATTGKIFKSITIKEYSKFLEKDKLVPGILNDDKIYYIKNVSKYSDGKDYRLYSFDENGKEIDYGKVKTNEGVISNNNIFFGKDNNNDVDFFKITKVLERK